MAQEINEGAAYLIALRQSAGQSGGTATAPAAEGGPSTQASPGPDREFKGAEKRRSTRYKCEGSAEVCKEGCDVPTRVAFTDISLHGCYVEAQATYPPGTVLHMKMEANGVRLETSGIVRVTYPYLGMGIAFEGISEENKGRLKQLLATLSHRSVIVGPCIASSLLATGPLQNVPLISDPAAGIQAFIEFFETRQILTREDFLRVLKKSQSKG